MALICLFACCWTQLISTMDVHTRALPGTPLINAKQRSPQLDLCRNTAGAMKMTSNWRSYDELESANDWRFCASSLGIECCQNQIILKIFSHQNMSFHILLNYFPNAIFGGQFISVELLHCGRPRECKRRHFLFRLITCLVTKPQYYSSLLSNKPGHFSKAVHFIFAKHSLFWQTFCQCYDSCPAYLNTINFGPYIFNCGQSSPS